MSDGPKLVDLSKFSNFSKINKVVINKKWNLNKILLISFFIFTFFFLYNCKYGIFKSTTTNYPLSYKLS